MFKPYHLATAFSLLAAPLAAQGFEGAYLDFQYQIYNDGEGFTIDQAEAIAHASYGISPNFGVQITLGHAQDVASSDPGLEFRSTNLIALHTYYDIAPTTRVAALVAYDTYNDGDYLYALEAVHIAGDLRIEGRVGRFDSAFEPATLVDLMLSYSATPALDLRAALHNVNYDNGLGFYTVASLGLSYNVTQKIALYADYGFMTNNFGDPDSYNGSLISAGVTIALGGPRNPMMFSYSPYY
mgnify:FL=1